MRHINTEPSALKAWQKAQEVREKYVAAQEELKQAEKAREAVRAEALVTMARAELGDKKADPANARKRLDAAEAALRQAQDRVEVLQVAQEEAELMRVAILREVKREITGELDQEAEALVADLVEKLKAITPLVDRCIQVDSNYGAHAETFGQQTKIGGRMRLVVDAVAGVDAVIKRLERSDAA